MRIWTVGHSTRTWEEFLGILAGHGIRRVVDVRTFPGSRRYPHFNQEAMKPALAEAGIDYIHRPDLGGRRRPRPDSTNTVWRNESFRGYADYMDTPDFAAALARLVADTDRPSALLCSEAVWWRCHRSMISDALKAAGHDVRHILDEKKEEEHPFTAAARWDHGRFVYGSADRSLPPARAPLWGIGESPMPTKGKKPGKDSAAGR